MAISRADAISQLLKKEDTYSDFSNNFIKHPITNELNIIKNDDSVKQSFKNLILTNIGEGLFNPYRGSDIRKSLFENYTPFFIEDITRYINLSAKQFETRVTVLKIDIQDQTEKNGIAINIIFSIINKPDPINLALFLKRSR